MQNNQALFILGSPGSGKDVVIRDITSNYNIIEFTSVQIDEMLSNNDSFVRAKSDKRNALLNTESIIVTANTFDLSFMVTKHILESIGYSLHLILVEADLSTSYDRLQNRNNLRESLNRISIGNSNKRSILSEFNSNIIVNNSKSLELYESRNFVSDILSDLKFESTLNLSDIVKPKIKSKLKSKLSTIAPKYVPAQSEDGMVGTITFTGVESVDEPSFETNLFGSSQQQNDKIDRQTTLNKTKKILFKKRVIPNGI
jgi:dephospho-CoA kinase